MKYKNSNVEKKEETSNDRKKSKANTTKIMNQMRKFKNKLLKIIYGHVNTIVKLNY